MRMHAFWQDVLRCPRAAKAPGFTAVAVIARPGHRRQHRDFSLADAALFDRSPSNSPTAWPMLWERSPRLHNRVSPLNFRLEQTESAVLDHRRDRGRRPDVDRLGQRRADSRPGRHGGVLTSSASAVAGRFRART